jgi:hypothetical protein
VIDAGGGPARPPLVIRSPARQVGAAAFLLLAVAVGAAFSEAPKGSKGNPWVAALFGLVFAACALRLAAVRVRASGDGVLVRNTWHTRRISWWDVTEVQVVAISGWRHPFLFPRPGAAVTLHLRDGDEILLQATIRRFRAGWTRDTYGPPFDRWLAAIQTFRMPHQQVSWN